VILNFPRTDLAQAKSRRLANRLDTLALNMGYIVCAALIGGFAVFVRVLS
jgi:hypothetical protein